MRWLPSKDFTGVGAGGRLVHREDRSERAEVLLRHGLHRQAKSSTDDRCDAEDGVPLTGDGVPCRPKPVNPPLPSLRMVRGNRTAAVRSCRSAPRPSRPSRRSLR